MNQKKIIIITILISFLLASSVIGIIIFRNFQKKQSYHLEKGEFTTTNSLEEETDYTTFEGDLLYPPESHINITNAELIYDLFTLEALKDMLPSISSYLDTHGYSEVINLTIQKNTLIEDRAYPYFICDMEGIDNKKLEVRYHLETMEYEFHIIER